MHVRESKGLPILPRPHVLRLRAGAPDAGANRGGPVRGHPDRTKCKKVQIVRFMLKEFRQKTFREETNQKRTRIHTMLCLCCKQEHVTKDKKNKTRGHPDREQALPHGPHYHYYYMLVSLL